MSAKKAVAKTLGGLGGKVGKAVIQNVNPLEVLREYCDYAKAAEKEVTRRKEIEAKREVAVTAIHAQRELIEQYFQHRFAERASALSRCFKLLEHAMEARNTDELDAALNSILGIVKDSPLKDFEAFRTAHIEGKIIEI